METVDTTQAKKEKPSIGIKQYHTKLGRTAYDMFEWHERDVEINDVDGKVVFKQEGISAPTTWSDQAVKIVANKYFRTDMKGRREGGVMEMIHRVVDTIGAWGKRGGYFTDDEAYAFAEELNYILLDQRACFNSPVWFNVGTMDKPQCSACFILSIEDHMESILKWYRDEGIIFKGGSGAGINLSNLRSKAEKVNGGGNASGPVSFMKAADASAGVIRSGGKTRRAAKMVILDIDHPDIEEFIFCKVNEEKKANVLLAAGYSSGIDGEAVGSVYFQNANNSVRVTDEFMKAVEDDGGWWTKYRAKEMLGRGGKGEHKYYKARDLFAQIAAAAWMCGDPGLQFDTTINNWHTCPETGRINSSNPCSEYMHLDNTACNLASINLLKFLHDDGSFDIEGFKHCVDIMITAMDILIDNSSYPTPEIENNVHDYRELGLGFANLGATLMAQGLAYDSDDGRAWAAAVSALLGGEAYLQSTRISERLGPFAGYKNNQAAMDTVINKHRRSAQILQMGPIQNAAFEAWDQAYDRSIKGYRNSQTTVIAPTGTIAFMMDCDTTGIEPDIALVKTKSMVGGGMLKIVNQTIPRALKKLGYSDSDVQLILNYVNNHETIEGSTTLKEQHLPIFDCAFHAREGKRSISPEGHIKMMAVVQPFISGAISKTVNLPNDATVDHIQAFYLDAWKRGLKSIAVYRDGCKSTQPLSAGRGVTREGFEKAEGVITVKGDLSPEQQKALSEMMHEALTLRPHPVRRKLPGTRKSIIHKFEIAQNEGYLIVGLYEDGMPGEIFITMNKQGSTISGLMDTWATAISFALQWGVPLDFLVRKFEHIRFEPAGFTRNPEIPQAKSIPDYIMRWLEQTFLSTTASRVTPRQEQTLNANAGQAGANKNGAVSTQSDAVNCHHCGQIMTRTGTCYTCLNCGENTGC
jgi:ribonucleoside-diphosphate reductase alpha chain